MLLKKQIKCLYIIGIITCVVLGVCLFCRHTFAKWITELRYKWYYRNCDHIVKIFHGQGNQLYHYAFGYILEKETGKKVCYDKSFYKEKNRELHERYVLDLYSIPKMNLITFSSKKNKMIKKYKQIGIVPNRWFFDKHLLHKKHTYYTGHYFSEYYYNKYRKDIVKMFTLKIPLDPSNQKMLTEIKKHKNSVSIHIRRGDYLKYEWYRDIITFDNYYNKALKIFEKMEDVHYFIFSDDPEWVKKNFKTGKPTTYVNINDVEHGYFDLELMRNCKHNIIANSTFSWWGAYLNENKDKIVVAPELFDTTDLPRYYLGLSNWIRIENI